jgi:CheY-like chemotaxis protein
LIVDDRAINRDFLVSLLKHFGYKLREAESGEQAWGIAVSGGLDLIITDVHMKGMDGYTLLEKLACHPDTLRIPAIVYTAEYKNPGFERFVVAHQLYKVLTKPSALELIVETVRGALGESAAPITPLEQGHRTTSLIEIMQDLAELVEPAKLLRAFCKAATALLYAEAGFVYLLSRGAEHPPQAFSSAMEELDSLEPADDLRLTSTLTQIISGHAIGRFRHVKPSALGLPFGNKEISSLLCVPIFTPAHNYGCLCLVGKAASEDFSGEDEHLVQTLASYLSMLYENAVFFDELQELTTSLAHEVEERKRAQEELERSRKELVRLRNESLNVFQELRPLVTAVQQFLQMLARDRESQVSGQQRDHLRVAPCNMEQINALISHGPAGHENLAPSVQGAVLSSAPT